MANNDPQPERSLPSLRRELFFASASGNTELLKELVESGAEVDARNFEGETALMVASYHGNVETVVALLDELGASPNLVDETDYSALTYAAANGHLKICQELCEPGKRRAKICRAIYGTAVLTGFLAGQVAEFLTAPPRPNDAHELKKAIDAAELHSHQTVAEYLRARKFKSRARDLLRNNRLKRRGVRSWPGPAHLWRGVIPRKRRSVSEGDASPKKGGQEETLPLRAPLSARDLLSSNRKKFRESELFPCKKFGTYKLKKGGRKMMSAPAGRLFMLGLTSPLYSNRSTPQPSPLPSPRRARSDNSCLFPSRKGPPQPVRAWSDNRYVRFADFPASSNRFDALEMTDISPTTCTGGVHAGREVDKDPDDFVFSHLCNLVTAGDGDPIRDPNSLSDLDGKPDDQWNLLETAAAMADSSSDDDDVSFVLPSSSFSRSVSAVHEEPASERFSPPGADPRDSLIGRPGLAERLSICPFSDRMQSLAADESSYNEDDDDLDAMPNRDPELIAVSAKI